MTQTQAPEKAPLDEVMLAMDVVDTLRHRELVLQRELSADERDQQLIERLRDIYAGQGIEVSDAVLERGVRDLREERFVYTPPSPSLARSLAHLYVSRSRWLPGVAFIGVAVVVALLVYQVLFRGPALNAIAQLPDALTNAHAAVVSLAQSPDVDSRADALLSDGRLALSGENFDAVRASVDELNAIYAQLDLQYEMRVVSRPGELSGVWRVPDSNPDVQNFYLIVEAIDNNGERVAVAIVNEETGRTSEVRQWGQRVDEALFRSTAADKGDDGIIQDDVIGAKTRGVMQPALDDGVRAGAITDW